MSRETLADYLDQLIPVIYVERRRGVGYISHAPRHSDVIEFLEDEGTGRPHPIDDAADHYLLRAFDNLRRELLAAPLPEDNGFNGEKRLKHQKWSDGYVGPARIVWPDGDPKTWPPGTTATRVLGHHYTNEVHGEFKWRSMHGDQEWPCDECDHPAKFHNVDDDGWSTCWHGQYVNADGHTCIPCNCGNNIGR